MEKTDFTIYQSICDQIFGIGAVRIKEAKASNKVIGALAHVSEFKEFKKNFNSRLERLHDAFKGTKSEQELLTTVAQIADPKNWEGAYAELAVYDIMNRALEGDTIELNVDLNSTESFTYELGGKVTNVDGHILYNDVYFDVKILADSVGDVLDNLIKDVIKSTGTKCSILYEYSLSDENSEFGGKRNQLKAELEAFLNVYEENRTDHCCLPSRVIDGLTYCIQWGQGVNTAVREYNPYRHAENCKDILLFRYAKKLLKNKRFYLVMVNFPWYNQKVNSFQHMDKIFYRALARRTFCGHLHDAIPMSQLNHKFNGLQTVQTVSTCLNGIIFIDDHIITEDSYSCCIYINPNASQPLNLEVNYWYEMIRRGKNGTGEYDDFRWDNY